MQLVSCVVVVCWVLAMCGHWLKYPWVGVAWAAANRVPIAAAGGVEAIIQGMHAHVGVAAIQENGAAALWSLTADGALWHHCWWRCVVRGACRAAAGGCAYLLVLHNLPAAHV